MTPSPDLEAIIRAAVTAELRRRNQRLGVLLGVVSAVGLMGIGLRTYAQASCAQTLPAPLVTFCPDTPALAAQINGNFQLLATHLQARTGPLTDGGTSITTPSLVISQPTRRASLDGTDLILDDSSRRGSAAGGTRRALVHESGDTLVVNYASDYTGGVTINGPVRVNGSLVATGTVSDGCPSTYPIGGGAVTMVDLGAFCITQSAPVGMERNALNWLQANEFCVSRGLRMCRWAEVSAAARLGRITTYPFNGGTRDTWVWVDQTASDSNLPGFGGCHAKLNADHGTFTLGEINCAIDGLSRSLSIEGACCL